MNHRGPGRDGWQRRHWSRKWASVAWLRPCGLYGIGRSPLRHPPPEWREDIGSPAHVSQSWKGETETLREPPPVWRKTLSTPRPEREGSPTKPEPWPRHSAWCPSPVVRPERPSALHSRDPEIEESGDAGNGESGDEQGRREEQRNPLVRPASGQERDRGDTGRPGPGRKPAVGTEPSADLALAILNGLDISSLPALRDLSTGGKYDDPDPVASGRDGAGYP